MQLRIDPGGRGTTAALAFLVGACTATAIGVHGADAPPTDAPSRAPARVVHGATAEVRTSPPGDARVRMLLEGTHAFVAQLELGPRAPAG